MNLSSYYLSPKRALEIVDQKNLQVRLKQAQTFQGLGGDHLGRMAVLNALEESLLSWMVSAKPPALGELILQGHATIGRIFTHRTDFHCKGVLLRQRFKWIRVDLYNHYLAFTQSLMRIKGVLELDSISTLLI